MVLQVALISEDEIVFRGLTSMLHDYRGAIQLVSLTSPTAKIIDVALFDSYAVGRHNRPTVAGLLDDHRIDKLVIYTWNFHSWLAADLIKVGVCGYLSKSLTAAQLLDALQAVHAGEIVVSPSSQAVSIAGSDWVGRSEGLTRREAQVLSLITMGLSNLEAAERMGISVNSLKSYIRSCYRTIDVDSRSRAVLWGVAHGLRTQTLREGSRAAADHVASGEADRSSTACARSASGRT